MAFVFLNRYLDLTEAMDDPDAGPLENADFVDTDIPFDFTIPDAHFITEAMREEVDTASFIRSFIRSFIHSFFKPGSQVWAIYGSESTNCLQVALHGVQECYFACVPQDCAALQRLLRG